MIVCFALGLMSKPMLVTLPCVLLLLDYWPLEKDSERPTRVLRAAARALVVGKDPAVGPGGRLLHGDGLGRSRSHCTSSKPLPWRIGNALISYVVYLRQFFWPMGLALLYPRREPDPAGLAGCRRRPGSGSASRRRPGR